MSNGTERLADHSRALDVLRGLAAALVVLGHTRSAIFSARDMDPAASGVLRILLAPTSFAEESVAVFFVLSGYLVGGQVLRQNRQDRFSWRLYLAKRLSRLWVVLLPGLVFTLLVDAVAVWIDRATVLAVGEAPRHGPVDVACNVAFLMPARCPAYGTNTSLWSLSYEFWFYIVFAAATVAFYGVKRRRVLVAAAGAGIVAASLLAFGLDLLWLFPAWLLGAVVADLRDRGLLASPLAVVSRRRMPAAWAVALGVLGAAFLASNLGIEGRAERYLLVGLATVPVLWLCLQPAGKDRWWLSLGAWTGSWSYSMYVFHRPLVVLFVVVTRDWWGADAAISAVAVYVLAPLAMAVTWLCFQLTERHTDVVRAAAVRLVGAAAPPRERADRPAVEPASAHPAGTRVRG